MKVGIIFSNFDLFQTGDVKMLEEAKNQCDYLIVGLKLDPSTNKTNKNTPSQSVVERYVQLKRLKYADEIIPYVSDQDIEDILRSFEIDILIIGEEYKTINFTEKEYCIKKGIEIYFNSTDHDFSIS